MTPEQKLAALFAAEAPPARDYVFQAGVAQRIARRRAWLTVAALIPWAIAATAVLWALEPLIAEMSGVVADLLAPTIAMLALALFSLTAALRLSRRFHRGVTLPATPK